MDKIKHLFEQIKDFSHYRYRLTKEQKSLVDEDKLNDDVFKQIKDFKFRELTEEQESLIVKLIINKELKERYKEYAKGGFGTTFKAVWKEGPISNWNYDNNQWKRSGKKEVALKCLHNSQGITTEFLKEVESNCLVLNSGYIVRCFEPKNADNDDDLLGIEYSESTRVDFTKLDINSEDYT
ncbi:kinase-like domain-containing protein [Rhizophagus irregularis DAOM 181602=DAOM 197198]|nr:kinase-like domain-containing protein [Rhizophagus irregularis DAOM 181602=DAOM 197198]